MCAGVLGQRKAESWLRANLRHNSPNKEWRSILLGFSVMVLIAGIWAGCMLAYHLILLVVSVTWHLIKFIWQLTIGLLELIIWKPAW